MGLQQAEDWQTAGSNTRPVTIRFASIPTHTERPTGDHGGIINRMKRSFGKAWKRSKSEPLMTANITNVKSRVTQRDSENGWLSYFTHRTSTTSNAKSRTGYTHTLDKPRKIRRSFITENTGRREPAYTSLEKDHQLHAKLAFNKRSISMPSDEMLRKRDLRRSVSSNDFAGLLGQNGTTANGGFRSPEERIVEQTKDFCRDYIVQVLKRNSLIHRVKISRSASPDQWLMKDIHAICNELERRNRGLCKNLAKQIGITLRSEEVLRKIFFEICLEIISTDISAENLTNSKSTIQDRPGFSRSNSEENQKKRDITWGRMMGIFVVTGAFSIDCIKQGHSELVDDLIEICGEFFQSQGLVEWISSHGGWEKLSEVNSNKTRDLLADTANVWNIFLVSACVVASLAFGVGLSNLTSTGG